MGRESAASADFLEERHGKYEIINYRERKIKFPPEAFIISVAKIPVRLEGGKVREASSSNPIKKLARPTQLRNYR